MTPEICKASTVGDTKQLIDLCDNKSYWVAKLKDNNCWMVQNLDLDLGTEWPDANLSDYDVASTAYKPVATATIANAATVSNVNTGTRSWSLGDYVIINPEGSSDCGSPKSSFAECPQQFSNIAGQTASTNPDFYVQNGKKTAAGGEYDAHYLVGNHYQWNTATAGTGGTITSGQANGSICPKGWRLPTSNSGGEFATLVTALGGTSSTNNITKAPFYGVRGGIINQNTGSLFRYAGINGYYWSSTPNSDGANAYYLTFSNTNDVSPSHHNTRQVGRSVRCIAR